MNVYSDYAYTQRWNKKREEFDCRVVVYVDGEIYAERLWSHPNSEVLHRMAQAFLLGCDAALYTTCDSIEPKPDGHGNTQLPLW